MPKVELVNLRSSTLTNLIIPNPQTRFQKLIYVPLCLYKFAQRVYYSLKTRHLLLSEQSIFNATLARWNARLLKADQLSIAKLTNFLDKTNNLEEKVPHLIPAKGDYRSLKNSLEMVVSHFYKEISQCENLGLQQLALLAYEDPTYLLSLVFQISKTGTANQFALFFKSALFQSAPEENKTAIVLYFLENIDRIQLSDEKVVILAEVVSSDQIYETSDFLQAIPNNYRPFFIQYYLNVDPETYRRIIIEMLEKDRTLEHARLYLPLIEHLRSSADRQDIDAYKNILRPYVNNVLEINREEKENSLSLTFEYYKMFKLEYRNLSKFKHYCEIVFLSLIKYLHFFGNHFERDRLIEKYMEAVNSFDEVKLGKFIRKFKKQDFGKSLRSLILSRSDNPKLKELLLETSEEKQREKDFLKCFTNKNHKEAAKHFQIILGTGQLSSMRFEGKTFWQFLGDFDDKEFLKNFQEANCTFLEVFTKRFGWNELALADIDLFQSPLIEDTSKLMLFNYQYRKYILKEEEPTLEKTQDAIFSAKDIVNVLNSQDYHFLDRMLPLSKVNVGSLFVNLQEEHKALYLLRLYPSIITEVIEYIADSDQIQTYLFFIALKNEWYGVLKYMIDTSQECLKQKSSKGISFLHFATPNALPLLQYIQNKYPVHFAEAMSTLNSEEGVQQLLDLTSDSLSIEVGKEGKRAQKNFLNWQKWLKLKLNILEAAYRETNLENFPNAYLSRLYLLIKNKDNTFNTLAANPAMDLTSLHQAWLILCPDFKVYLRSIVEEVVINIDHEKSMHVWASLNEFSKLLPLKEWLNLWHTPYQDGKTLLDILKPLNKKIVRNERNILTSMQASFFVADSISFYLFPLTHNALFELSENEEMQHYICRLYWLHYFQSSKTLKIYNLLKTIILDCKDNDNKNLLKALEKSFKGIKPIISKLWPNYYAPSGL